MWNYKKQKWKGKGAYIDLWGPLEYLLFFIFYFSS